MIGRASRQLPPQMPSPPSYQKVNPADQSIFFIILRSPTLPLSTLDEIAQSTVAQRISMVNGVAQVNVFGSQKYAVRIDVDPRELAARSIGIDEVASAVQSANVEPADRHHLRREDLHGADQRAVDARVRVRADHHRLPRRQPGAARRGGARLRRRGERQDGELAERRALRLPVDQKQPGTNVVQVVDAIKALLPAIKEQLPASVNLDIRSDRSITIKESVHDVKLTLLVTVGLVDPGHLPVPAQPVGHHHPQPGAARLARRHVLGDVPARLQPRQPVADGAHALGRLRRGRRHRDAGEHRPAHGDGQAADAGRLRRLAGGGVHDSVDDAVARGGVHPGALHGRHRRPPAARVRGHHRRGDSGVGLRLHQPDADAVQPLPAAAARSTAPSTTRSSACSTPGGGSTTSRCAARCASAR